MNVCVCMYTVCMYGLIDGCMDGRMNAIGKLHNKKAAGFDDISAEHIKYAGPVLVSYALFLILLWNLNMSHLILERAYRYRYIRGKTYVTSLWTIIMA